MSQEQEASRSIFPMGARHPDSDDGWGPNPWLRTDVLRAQVPYVHFTGVINGISFRIVSYHYAGELPDAPIIFKNNVVTATLTGFVEDPDTGARTEQTMVAEVNNMFSRED